MKQCDERKMYKKRVLMVHNYYQIGGGEHTVFKNEVALLREKGHEVIEYTRSNNEIKSSLLKLISLPFTTIWSWRTYLEIKKIIKKHEIDIVHCHNIFPLISPSVYYAARSMNIPIIQTIHNFRLLCPNGCFFCDGKICEKCDEFNNFFYAIKNKCYRDSKLQTIVLVAMLKFHRMIGTYNKISYIFLTEFNRKKFHKLIDISSDQVFVKPNFCNIPTLLDSNAKNFQKNFIFAGRFDTGKGVMNLVKLWKELPNEYTLKIFGDGELKDDISSIIQETSNIYLSGFVSQELLFNELKKSNGLITPYLWYEGFPMNITESFSIGVPVVSSNNGNAAYLVRSSNAGTLFSLDSSISLKKALDEVIINKNKYSQNAINYYNNNLTKEINYNKLVEIYDKTRVIK